MKHIAVIGSGISGLAAAWLLSRRHHVTLYEREPRLGGHTHTVVVDGPSGRVALDTGFIVHNRGTYPNLVRLFAELGVDTLPSDMSFSVSCAASGFEYSSRGLRGFFADPANVARRAHYRLLADILRFNREAPRVLDAPGTESSTLGEYLREARYSEAFVMRYLAPMASAIWSASLESIDAFPIRTLVLFMQNHGMLSVDSHRFWRVVAGGSHTYVPRLVARVRGGVHLGTHLLSVRRDEHGVDLLFAGRPRVRVDDVVFACHGDQVLPLLADPSDAERDVFGAFTTTANDVWLHTDGRVLPVRAPARASWNYRLNGHGNGDSPPSVTYDLTRLQGLACRTQYCVTLNPRMPLADGSVLARFTYRHPRMTAAAIHAQRRWRDVSGIRRTHYCGAYWRYGFHEDGLMSAMRVARDFGVHW